MSLFNDASLITTPNGVKAGKLFSVKPFDGSGDFTWVRNTNATRVNENGLIETVGANVPRLDYSNGECPCILVEPQRTNLNARSEQFSLWSVRINVSITNNYIISPTGFQTASRLQFTANGFLHDNSFIQVNGTTYTISAWAKRNNNTNQNFGFFVNGTGAINSLINLTNEWVRYTYTYTAINNSRAGFSGQNGLDVSVFGFQIEQGSNATSYIPTVASAVTRNADVGTLNTTGLGITEITETFETGAPNVITTIPSTYQLPNGRIKTIVGL